MPMTGEVVIGIDVGAREVRVGGFDLVGRELALATRAIRTIRGEDRAVELDPPQFWQTVVRGVRQLADRTPDLGRRTVAIGLSGAPGGLCLVDEDGDPLCPATSPLDPVRLGPARRDRSRFQNGLLESRLRWLEVHRPALLDRAAYAMTAKDWIGSCLSGEAFAEAIEATTASGNGPDGTLEAHGLTSAAALPCRPLRDDTILPLGTAAAAVTGLWEGTPVVMAPPGPLAAAIALGVATLGEEEAISILDEPCWHGAVGPVDAAPADLTMRLGDRMLVLRAGPVGGEAVQWLGAQLHATLAEVGLIGQSEADLLIALDARAGEARPLAATFAATSDGSDARWSFDGLGPESTFPALLRAIYEAIGRSAAMALGERSPAARLLVAGDLAESATLRGILAAITGLPICRSLRRSPVATGAALSAAVAAGRVDSLGAAGKDWVHPHLESEEMPDSDLAALYAGRSPGRPQMALAPLSTGRIAPVTFRDSSEAR